MHIPSRPFDPRTYRRGVTAAEVLVVATILFLLLMGMLLALPRQRENARLSSCRLNLMQIGLGLELYDNSQKALPTVPALSVSLTGDFQSPLQAVLETLSLPNLTKLKADQPPPKPIVGSAPGETFVIGFACPSDPYSLSEAKTAAISYRATTGDQTSGANGPFAPGRTLTISEIEAGDGKSFTSAFAERLTGNTKEDAAKVNYSLSSATISGTECPVANASQWRGDAGSSWREVSWRSTLYNHAIRPNASPSCISADGSTALMGASSAHVSGTNVLMLDGAVRGVVPTIDPKIWAAMATTSGSPSP